MCFHPLMTFQPQHTLSPVPRCAVFHRGLRPAVLERVDALAAMFSAIAPRHADTAVRRTLHLAGVFTNNFVNVLSKAPSGFLPPTVSHWNACALFLRATVANAVASGPHDSADRPCRAWRQSYHRVAARPLCLPNSRTYRSLTTLIETYIIDESNKLRYFPASAPLPSMSTACFLHPPCPWPTTASRSAW